MSLMIMSKPNDILKLHTACEHPRIITNKNGVRMLVSCGHCLACLTQRATQRKKVLMSEYQQHKYCLFVTLTYDNKNIPLMDCVSNDFDAHLKDFYDIRTGEYLGSFKFKCYADYYNMVNKAQHGGPLPYAPIRDLQLFIKRLRKNLTKYSNEKIRYYGVSEYGQLHFRPHFHLLLFFDEGATFNNIRYSVHSSWSLGIVDCQTPKNGYKSCNYLCQYLNGSYGLPPLYSTPFWRQKQVHSQHLGFVVDETLRQAVKEQDYSRIMRYGLQRYRQDLTATIRAWRSIENYLFPRCREYAQLSSLQRLRVYNCLRYSTEVLNVPGDTIREISENLYNNIINKKYNEQQLSHFFPRLACDESGELIVPTEENFRASLYISHHFAGLCDWLGVSPSRLVAIIEGYYQYRSLSTLNEWYELMQELSTSCDDDTAFYIQGAGYTNVFLDDTININGIIFDTGFVRRECQNSTLAYKVASINLSMKLSAIKHRTQNEYYISNLR